MAADSFHIRFMYFSRFLC